jgi:hypothetical protein
VQSPLISVTGATATGVWSLLLYTQPRSTPPSPVLTIHGRYEERYVKTDAGWRFAEVRGIILMP